MISTNLSTMAWPAIERLIAAGGDMLVLPVGATEQHGAHLPINTDTVIVENLCIYACELAEVAMLPPLSYSVSVGHTNRWPGTFSLSHETFINSVCELTDWGRYSGFKRLLLVNSHFGNDASLRVAVDKIRTRFMGEVQVGLSHTFQLSDSIWSYFTSDAADLHANRAETDLMLYLAPELVDMSLAEDDPDRTVGKVFSYPVAQTSLNGVTGCPSSGCIEAGESLFVEMGEALAAVLRAGKTESAPLELPVSAVARSMLSTPARPSSSNRLE